MSTQELLERAAVLNDAAQAGQPDACGVVVVAANEKHAAQLRARLRSMGAGDVDVSTVSTVMDRRGDRREQLWDDHALETVVS